MAILASGDFHLQNNDNLRTKICLDYMEYLLKYMKENHIENFIFLGDLISTSNKIFYDTFVPVFHMFNEWKQKDINIFFVLGNHEILDKKNRSLLELLSPLGKVIQRPETIEIDGFNYDFMPYTLDKSNLPKKSSVLFTHIDINGCYTTKDNFFEEEDLKDYSLTISGHYHKKFRRDNIIYPGAPYQLSFAEEDQDKFFAVVDGDSCELVKYEDAPQYITIDLEKYKDYNFKNKFVQVRITNKLENFIKLKSLLYEQGALEVTPLFIKEDKPRDESGHTVDVSEGVLVSAAKYLKGIKADGIDNKKLLKKFKEIIKEIA